MTNRLSPNPSPILNTIPRIHPLCLGILIHRSIQTPPSPLMDAIMKAWTSLRSSLHILLGMRLIGGQSCGMNVFLMSTIDHLALHTICSGLGGREALPLQWGLRKLSSNFQKIVSHFRGSDRRIQHIDSYSKGMA